jgi:hypothetical protein
MKSRNEFGNLLRDMELEGKGIEIGVATGKYSKILLDNTDLEKIYFIDPWKHYPDEEYTDSSNVQQSIQDDLYKQVCNLLEPYEDRAEVIREDCAISVNDFEDEFFDFIYIDANHMYEAIYRDLRDWYPKAKNGSVFAGHDYMNRNNRLGVCGVKRAVDEFCEEIKVKPMITGGTRRCPASWYIIKGEG